VLVTGAAGFAGSHLLDLLTGEGIDVVAWHRSDGTPPRPMPHTTWQAVDLLDREAVLEALGRTRPAYVYHCAGAAHVGKSWENAEPTFAVNVRGTHHIIEALRDLKIEARMLIPSSAMVYGASDKALTEEHPLAPASPYALSKLAQEMRTLRAAVEDGLEVIVVRAFNHTGPRQVPDFAAPSFARQIALMERGALPPVIRAGNLAPRRDLSDVRDVVRAYVALMDRGAGGAIYNVASGVGRPIGDVLEALIARARIPVTVETDPSLLRPNDTAALVGDCTRLQRDTGWSPQIPFETMLDDLLEYWRAQ
jgi:GDP-4-dehydro-6-deoxy-D-mannose reductase